MQVLQDPCRVQRSPKRLTGHEEVKRLWNEVLNWSCGWGGVGYWQIFLDTSYTTACEQDRVNSWMKEVLDHASYGRGLLIQLRALIGRLPDGSDLPHEVKELIRTTVDLIEMVTMGVTIINMRCSILPDNRWQVHNLFEDDGGVRSGSSCDGDSERSSDDEYISSPCT